MSDNSRPPVWIETNWSVLSDVFSEYLRASETAPGQVAKLVKSYQDLLEVAERACPRLPEKFKDAILISVRAAARALPFPVDGVSRQLIRFRASIELYKP